MKKMFQVAVVIATVGRASVYRALERKMVDCEIR